MAEIFERGMFFDNVGEDVRTYTAEDLGELFKHAIGNGVGGSADLQFDFATQTVAPGFVMIEGRGRYFRESTVLSLNSLTSGYVCAVLRSGTEARSITIEVTDTLTQTAELYTLPLASFSVDASGIATGEDLRDRFRVGPQSEADARTEEAIAAAVGPLKEYVYENVADTQAALEGLPPITIRWDEDGAGRDSFSLDDHPDMYQSRFFKVSDELPTMDQVIGGTYTHKDEYDVGTVTRQITANMVHQEQNCLLIDNSIIVVYDTDVDIGGAAVTAPSTGIYFADFFYGAYYAVTELTYGTKTVKEYVDGKTDAVTAALLALAGGIAAGDTAESIVAAAQAFLQTYAGGESDA